jgi:hypothetical protein
MTKKDKKEASDLAINPDALAAFLAGLEKTGLIRIDREKLNLR